MSVYVCQMEQTRGMGLFRMLCKYSFHFSLFYYTKTVNKLYFFSLHPSFPYISFFLSASILSWTVLFWVNFQTVCFQSSSLDGSQGKEEHTEGKLHPSSWRLLATELETRRKMSNNVLQVLLFNAGSTKY